MDHPPPSISVCTRKNDRAPGMSQGICQYGEPNPGKNCRAITHVKVPMELLEGGKKRKQPMDQTDQRQGTRGTNPQSPKNLRSISHITQI